MSLFEQQITKDKGRTPYQQFQVPEKRQQYQYHFSIIQKFNVIQMGINFLVPHFWYQQLCRLNFKMKQFKNLELPSFTIKQILMAYGFVYQASSYSINQQKLDQQQNNVFSNSNFANIQVFRGIKLQKNLKIEDFSWKIINPHLWRIIKQKLQQIGTQSQCLPIHVQEDFLKQNKVQSVKGSSKVQKNCISTILFRNKIYSLNEDVLNKYIFQSLLVGYKKQINIVLIDQKSKIQLSGYFDVKLKLKNIILSLKNSFNFKEEVFQVFKGNHIKEQVTRLTTLQILGQDSSFKIFMPNYQTLNQGFQLRKLSFQKYLKSNMVQKACSQIHKIADPLKDHAKKQKKYIDPLAQLKDNFKFLEIRVSKKHKANAIYESQLSLKEIYRKRISVAHQQKYNRNIDQFGNQEQAMVNESDESGSNQRNIRSISTYECTPNLSFHSEEKCNPTQYRKIVRERFRNKRKKINHQKQHRQKIRSTKKNGFQYAVFKQISKQELIYFQSVAKQAIFNSKCLLKISESKQKDQQKYFRDQLQKLVQYFQEKLQANQLSKDLSQSFDFQKRQMQRLSRQKMKQEEIITIVDNQVEMDIQRQTKIKQRFYFDKEQQFLQKQKKKLKHLKYEFLSSRKSQKAEREQERVSIQTETQQIQFYSDQQHMLDEDQ